MRRLRWPCVLLLVVAGCEGDLVIESLTRGPSPSSGPPRIEGYDGGGVRLLDSGALELDAGERDLAPPPAPPDPPQSALCPPTGGEGTNVGDVAPDMTFPLVGGGTVSVRSTCAHRTTFIYRFTESCGICRGWLDRDANGLYQSLQSAGFEMIVVVGSARQASGAYGTPTEADAARIRDYYDLAMPVAWEPDNEFLWTLHISGAGVGLLMTEGNVIAARLGRVSDQTVRTVAERSE